MGGSAATATATAAQPKPPRVIDLLRRFTPKFMQWERPVAQVKSVLSRILTCRTAALKGHLYKCQDCHQEVNVYNSCTDRHCPQCGGARRADWLDKSSAVLLPNVPYFQVVFTLPDKLSGVILGNRSELYGLLFRSAWQALNSELRRTAQFHPAALMVLHTWNQQLEHHPHIHAIVPGAGPSLDGRSWRVARHPQHRRRRKPYLTDNVALGRAFRDAYLRELKRLLEKGKLQIGGSVEFLNDQQQRETFLAELADIDWNVFIEGPPQGKSNPANVLKYLAGYLTGGPISNSRILSADKDEVWIKARPKQSAKNQQKKRGMNAPRPYRLNGRQFTQRWALHILPRGFTRSRSYGGYHVGQRSAYLAKCRELLPDHQPTPTDLEAESETIVDQPPRCPHCTGNLKLLYSQRRPSWRDVFEREVYRSSDYSPVHHLSAIRPPPMQSLGASS